MLENEPIVTSSVQLPQMMVGVTPKRPTTATATTTTTTTSPNKPDNTFYRRPLPDKTCIALSSPKGRKLFSSAMINGGLDGCFFPLCEQHSTQSEPAYCGISSLVIALNALAIDPKRTWKGSLWRWYDESMLNCCVDLNEVKMTGITVGTFKCLAVCQGVHATVTYADSYGGDENNKEFEQKFRAAVIESCIEQGRKNSNRSNKVNNNINESDVDNDTEEDTGAQVLTKVLLASYDRAVLGQTGSGHFSPITAYDPISDSVLIMDTARFKYGSHWVQLSLLANAMKPIDPDSKRSRGFILLSNPVAEATTTVTNKATDGSLPVSVLLRSELIKNNPARKEFKSYLDNRHRQQLPISLDDVIKFWTKNGTDTNYIWEIVKPKCMTPNEENRCLLKIIDGVRSLISCLLQKQQQQHCKFVNEAEYSLQLVLQGTSFDNTDRCASNSNCNSDLCRLIPMSPMEVIYITYLASLSDKERKEIIHQSIECGSEIVDDNKVLQSYQHQLVAEAELIRYSIDVSDEILVE